MPQRDPALVALLRSLCSPKALPRLQALLLSADASVGFGLDMLSALIVALLDHFVRQSSEEPERLKELAPLAPQLQRVVDEADTALSGSHDFLDAAAARVAAARAEEVRVRAGSILVRLPGCGLEASSLPSREPASLEACCGRARVLEVLRRESERRQAQKAESLEMAKDKGARQNELVTSGGLDQEPCVREERMVEFCAHLARLREQRAALGREVEYATRATDTIRMSLDQRAMIHGMFKEEVGKLDREIEEQAVQEGRSQEAQALVRQQEAAHQEAQRKVEWRQGQLREAEALMRQAAARAHDTEGRAAVLSNREAELAEVCHNAPANLERLQARLADAVRRREGLREEQRQLAIEGERAERRVGALREREREAEAALRSLGTVQSELRTLKATLNSELILSSEEVANLRRLEMLLQPARPSRLRRAQDGSGGSAHDGAPGSAADEADAPVWDADVKAEKEFRDTPHFRSFSALRDRRAELWGAERRWLQDVAGRAEAVVGNMALQRQEKERAARAAQDEEEQVRREITVLDDHEGHAARHAQAREEAAVARQRAQQAAEEAAEAAGTQRLAEAYLAKEEEVERQASEDLLAARAAADEAAESSMRVRAGLEKRCRELEEEARSQLQGWRSLEMQERRLELLQARVDQRIGEEAGGRAELREEVRKLISELHVLDEQLDGHLT